MPMRCIFSYGHGTLVLFIEKNGCSLVIGLAEYMGGFFRFDLTPKKHFVMFREFVALAMKVPETVAFSARITQFRGESSGIRDS